MQLPPAAPVAGLVTLLVLGAACAVADGPEPIPIHHMPQPTEHVLGPDAESTNKSRRKAWEAERHRAAPEVDWKAIEQSNGRKQREKRNVLAAMSATVDRWEERGSDNLAGRMHAAVPAPDGSALYAGSAKGGVWHRAPVSGDWTPLGDNLDGGAHHVAVVPGATAGDPDVIVRATKNGKIHVSRDNGATWLAPAGLPSNVNKVRRIFTTQDGTHTIFIVLRNFTTGSNRTKLFRSTDAALSFQKVSGLSTFEGDAWSPRDGAGALWCLKQSGMNRSLDNGQTWTVMGPLPVTATRAELAGSEAGAPRFYAVFQTAGGEELYRSDDAGVTWSFKQTLSGYWDKLTASIVDPDLVAWGGVELHRSTDGGGSFSFVNTWGAYYNDPENKLHADIMGIDVCPATNPAGEIWYISTDGGLYESTTALASVKNLSLDGLRVSQYYTTHTSTANPEHVIAGSQDQGYQWSEELGSALDPLRSFDQLISGDYGHAVSGDGTHEFVFSVYPGFVLVHIGEDSPKLYQANFPSGESYSWLPSLAPDPLDRESFFFCATKIYRYSRVGPFNNWVPSIWSTTSFGSGYLTGLTWSPLDPNRGYAITDKGDMYRSLDRGVTWAKATGGTGPGPHYFYGTAVLASELNLDTVYVGGSGYSNPPVYRSTDGGQSFQAWSTGLPSTLVYSLAEAPDGSGRIYAGTETGAYELDPATGIWTDITAAEAPINTYWSAEAVPSEQVIRFGTHGRGIWDFDIGGSCSYEPYGVNLGGTNTLSLDTTSNTRIGQDHVFELSGATSTGPGFLIWSPSQALLPVAGGTLLVDPVVNFSFPMPVTLGGTSQLTLSIPSSPGLAGAGANFQAVVIDVSLQELLTFSNGLGGQFCP